MRWNEPAMGTKPAAATRLLDKVARILGDWPSGALLDACKPHAIARDRRRAEARRPRRRRRANDHERRPRLKVPSKVRRRRKVLPRRRTELLDPGVGGGCVDATLAKTTDSHPSTVAVRVAAKAAFDVFEAAWPKHAEGWLRDGMEPRWRRLVTHGVLETPEESGTYARGGYPSVPRGRTSAEVAEHEREEAFAERRNKGSDKGSNKGSTDRGPGRVGGCRRPAIDDSGKLPDDAVPTAVRPAARQAHTQGGRVSPPTAPSETPVGGTARRPFDESSKLKRGRRTSEGARRSRSTTKPCEAAAGCRRGSGVSTGSFDPNDVAKTAEESALYRDLEALDARMETRESRASARGCTSITRRRFTGRGRDGVLGD